MTVSNIKIRSSEEIPPYEDDNTVVDVEVVDVVEDEDEVVDDG
jgi:hypothetical protein